jgi:hypothetical protein
MKSICNQILDFLLRGLPYADTDIGIKVQTTDITLSTSPNKVNLELAPADYNGILQYITDASKNVFTISGIYLKNDIISFENFTLGLFTVKFKKPHYKKVGEEVEFEDFTNIIYNGTYKITGIVDAFTVRVYNTTIPQINLTVGLGYNSVEYIGGLNTVTSLSDEGSNIVSYTFDEQYFSPINIADIDTNKKPYINYLYDSVLCLDKDELLETNLQIKKFLLIDTSSLVFSPHRSNSNKTDANYSTIGSTSQFTRNVNLNIYYVIDETTNSSDADIELTKIDRALNLILRRSLEVENGYSTTLTIGTALKDNSIPNGRMVFEYGVEFYISYVDNDNVLLFQDAIYPIEKVQANNDLIVFS